MKSLEVVSPLTPDECAARLSAAIDYEDLVSATGLFGSKPVGGRVVGDWVRLRQRIDYHNSFQTVLVGTLHPTDGGTVFRGTFGMHPVIRRLLAGLAGVVAVVGGGVAVAGLARWPAGEAVPAAVVIPPVTLAFGAAAVAFCRFLARGEAEFLAAFVAETLAPGRRRTPTPPS